LTALLSSILERRIRQAAEINVSQAFKVMCQKLKRLYRMVEDAMTELDDTLRGRISDLKLSRDEAKAALDRTTRGRSGPRTLDPALIDAFSRVVRDNITTGEIPFRKAYFRSLADRIEVDDHVVRIIGDQATIAQAVAHGGLAGNAVRYFERKWRTRLDSNVWPSPSEGSNQRI
jgi:site-specific DNA recombinase